MKTSVSKEKYVCPQCCWLRGHVIFELGNGISSVFACSYGVQVESCQQKKNGRKSCDTVPFKETMY